MAVVLSLLVIFLATCDAAITYNVLSEYGLEVELNYFITELAPIIGLAPAIAVGVGIPTLIYLTLANLLRSPLMLLLLISARAGFLVKQIDAHRL